MSGNSESNGENERDRCLALENPLDSRTGNGKRNEQPSWQKTFIQIRDDGAEFFVNSQEKPTIFLPGDGHRKEWPIDSQRVRDLVAAIHYELSGCILKSTERELLLSLMREECRRGERRLAEGEAQADEPHIIVQGVIALVNESRIGSPVASNPHQEGNQVVFHDRTPILQKRLSDLQRTSVISAYAEIPVFTNIFARKLNRLIPVLRGYGVAVTMSHKEDGSYVKLEKLETFQREMSKAEAEADAFKMKSSGESSGRNRNAGRDLPPADDADGEFRTDLAKSSSGTGDAGNQAATKKGGAK